MEIRTHEQAAGLRTDDTLPTVSPRRGRSGERVVGQAVGMTHVGRVRESNEDHFVVADLERAVRLRQTSLPAPPDRSVRDAEGSVLMVADGMGGHGDGDLASAVTLDTVLEYVTYAMPWSCLEDDEAQRALAAGVHGALEHCQDRLLQVAARKGASASMGTTLTMAYVRWPDAWVAHVGDSRCYQWREGHLTQVTRDHTLAAQMRERYGGGDDLSQFEHVLVNAVGGDRRPPDVEAHRIHLVEGDRLLLSSDGLHGELSPGAIAGLLGGASSPAEACHGLISAALDAGGHDNVTTVVAFF